MIMKGPAARSDSSLSARGAMPAILAALAMICFSTVTVWGMAFHGWSANAMVSLVFVGFAAYLVGLAIERMRGPAA